MSVDRWYQEELARIGGLYAQHVAAEAERHAEAQVRVVELEAAVRAFLTAEDEGARVWAEDELRDLVGLELEEAAR